MTRIRDEEPCPCGSGRTFGDCHAVVIRERANVTPKNRMALNVIPRPDPDTRSVFEKAGGDSVFFVGTGEDQLDCGGCGAPLAVAVSRDQFHGLVLRCVECGAYNDT